MKGTHTRKQAALTSPGPPIPWLRARKLRVEEGKVRKSRPPPGLRVPTADGPGTLKVLGVVHVVLQAQVDDAPGRSIFLRLLLTDHTPDAPCGSSSPRARAPGARERGSGERAPGAEAAVGSRARARRRGPSTGPNPGKRPSSELFCARRSPGGKRFALREAERTSGRRCPAQAACRAGSRSGAGRGGDAAIVSTRGHRAAAPPVSWDAQLWADSATCPSRLQLRSAPVSPLSLGVRSGWVARIWNLL